MKPMRSLLPAALVLLTGCPGSEDLTEAIIELEATGYNVCSIDVLDRMQCAKNNGESYNFDDLALGSNSFIELDASQTLMCALEDNDGDGAGDVYCFKLADLELAGLYDVYEGPYTSFTVNGENFCAIDVDGAVVCPDAADGSGLTDLPDGVFEDLWSVDTSFVTGICALTSDGVLECSGDEGFEEQLDECPLPASGVVDMDAGGTPFPIALTEDGELWGWNNQGCVAEVARDATLVETGQHVVCTLDDVGEISCIDLNTDPSSSEVDDDSILENAPEGSYYQLAGNPNNVGGFMCASSGHEITCWGDGWNDGVAQTFSFPD